MQNDTVLKEHVERRFSQVKENFEISTLQAMSMPLAFPETFDIFEFNETSR